MLASAGGNGISTCEHLEQVEKSTGFRPPELDGPEFPELLAHIWNVFLQLHTSRPAGGVGPGAITESEMRAWMQNHRVDLLPWECEVIKMLDNVYMRSISRERSNG